MLTLIFAIFSLKNEVLDLIMKKQRLYIFIYDHSYNINFIQLTII